MKSFKYLNKIAAGYVIGSIFIGPGLVFLVGSLSPGPIGDCGDDAWGRAGYRGFANIGTVIRHYDRLIQISEGIMLGIGVIILGLLLARARHTPILLLILVIFMVACYGFVIWFFNEAVPCGY